MKKILTGFVLALVLVGLVLVGLRAYRDDALTNATATYLFSETEVKGKDGKALSRADLLDLILRDAIAKAQAPGK